MLSQGKKATLMVFNPVDRLSDLPDSVIHLVISFLGTKEAARTTILSKRWSTIWSTIPVLDFQPHYFFKEEDHDSDVEMGPTEKLKKWLGIKGCEEYLRLIDITMERYARNSMSLRKLTMEFPKVDRRVTSKLDKWLGIAVRNQVEDLSISFTIKSSTNYRLPAIVFSAKSLKKLSCCMVEVPNYEPERLISLQHLDLVDATVEEGVIQHMINSCPLNTLSLRTCFGLKSIVIPHFSKIETLGFWRTVETGGTINLESSSLVQLSCYSCGNAVAPFLPMKIHVGLISLRKLAIYDTSLEMLTFCNCSFPENICINGSQLKELGLHDCYGLANVIIDAPNLDILGYTGEQNIMFVATNIPLKCKIHFNIEAVDCDTDWFIKLKDFLTESRIFEFLSVWSFEDASIYEFDEDESRKVPHVPPYKLREMRISLPTSVYVSSLSALIDGLFWSCRPDQLCIPVHFFTGHMIFETFLKLMGKKVKSWRHPLKRIEVASIDGSNLIGGLEVEFRFNLYW